MKTALARISILLFCAVLSSAAKKETKTFYGYVDTSICARLMLGPVTAERVACSENTRKQGNEPVLVRLQDNTVFEIRNKKTVKKLAGQTVKVTGEVNEKNGKIKIATVEAAPTNSIPKDETGGLLDVRNYRTSGQNRIYEQIRHTLAMMPYISEFDFIAFSMVGNDVILNGWTIRITNRDAAYRRVKSIEGVGKIINNIEVLQLGSMDMQIRAAARAVLQQSIPMYFWGNGSDIKIIVKNGDIILLGVVMRKADSDIAFIRCNSIPGVFHVYNLLRVQPGKTKKKG